nr:uncharacterized protein LOC117851453 isoform X2 [Setaria viridis]
MRWFASGMRPRGTPASAPAALLSAIGAPPGEAWARGSAHRLGQDGCKEEQAHVATGASLSGVELGLWGGVGGGAVDERWMGYGELLRPADSTAAASGPWRKWRGRKKKGLTSGIRDKIHPSQAWGVCKQHSSALLVRIKSSSSTRCFLLHNRK